jgi:ketosteroid isomerase-like protein
MLNYAAYEKLFNTGDDEALLERFFHEDAVFASTNRAFQGKAELREFLSWAHNGVREVMRPQTVMQKGDQLFAEVDMDFHALKERPGFPYGHLHPGDMVTVKFFVIYRMRDDKIAELRAMTWPPGHGVSKLPRLGAHPSQMAAFRAYCAAFSNADFDRFSSFYTDDVRLELGSVPPIAGKQGIVEFYRPMFKRVRENITVNSVEATDASIVLDATARFTAIEDAPDFVVGPLRLGEFIEGRVIVTYRLRNGLIEHIGVQRGGEMRRNVAADRG